MSEPNEEFLAMLKDSSIEDERKEILPSFRSGKKRLEIEVINKILNDEGIDAEEPKTDFDFWCVLKNLKKRNDVLYILKDCLKEAEISCNDAILKTLKKDQFIELLFNVFDIYPKAHDERTAMTSVAGTESGSEISEDAEKIRKAKEKMFPNGIDGKQEIEYAEIADMLPEKVSSVDDLEKLMLTTEAGNKVKEMFKACCRMKEVDMDFGKLGGLERKIYVPIFFDVFEIKFPQIAKINSIAVDENTASTSAKSSSELQNISLALTFEQVQEIYKGGEKISVGEREGYDISDNVTVYRDMPVTLSDGFWIKIPDNVSISHLCAALINSQTEEVVAVGSIEEFFTNSGETRPHLIFDADKIKFEQFERQREFNVMLIPVEQEDFLINPGDDYHGELYIFECDLNLGTLKNTDNPLCIDFGTSNTTVGTYGLGNNIGNNNIQLVKFRDVTSEVLKISDLLPTVVYVDSFKDDRPIFKFGYEAHKEIIDSDYSTRASVFYEIKRWINSINKTEKLFDKKGNTIPNEISHKEILKAYLDYIIEVAQQQFKVKFRYLHFTAPVKLKKQFLKIMSEIFPKPEYFIEREERSLDEGIAIVYHYIAEQLRERKNDEPVTGNILILDCGGGTTDLASCKYSIGDSNVGPVLKIETGFENGESNFGGNNITYLILQMLKIKIAAHLKRQGNLTMQELIIEDENTILCDIDDKYDNKDKIYEKFLAAYKQAENIIPTKFSECSGRNEKLMIKRNYYYLWQMAEAIKIEFYRSNLVNVDFDKEQDKKIYVDDVAQYYLYVKTDGKTLTRHDQPMDKVEITIKEINRIICPEIYALLNTLLRQYTGKNFETIEVLQKFRYRLSGQSCKIALFNDLLKEFIPGVLIRNRTQKNLNSDNKTDSSVLKKFCIEGSIEYMRDKARGELKPILNTGNMKNIYAVYLEDGGELSKCAALDYDGKVTIIKRPSNMREAIFIVNDSNGKRKNRVSYSFNLSEQPRYNLESLEREIKKSTSLEYEKINQMISDPLRDIDLQRDNNNNPICCLFILPARDRYGFYIWQVVVKSDKDGKYYKSPATPKFETFESETLQTFFDGYR